MFPTLCTCYLCVKASLALALLGVAGFTASFVMLAHIFVMVVDGIKVSAFDNSLFLGERFAYVPPCLRYHAQKKGCAE